MTKKRFRWVCDIQGVRAETKAHRSLAGEYSQVQKTPGRLALHLTFGKISTSLRKEIDYGRIRDGSKIVEED